MSRPYFSVKHVESLALLPKKLTPGRIYFIDDEQYIIIDHGNGLPPVIYGNRPGPQGASGEPQPQLQEQVDTLAQTQIKTQSFLWEESNKVRTIIQHLTDTFNETIERFQEMVDTNAQSIMSLATTIKTSFDNYDSAIATLGKAVANLYPDGTYHIDDDDTQQGSSTTPLLAQSLNIGDDVSSEGTRYTVLNSQKNADGSLSLSLRNNGAFSDTSDLMDFETMQNASGSWVIQETNKSDGTTLYDLQSAPTKIDTLVEGDTLNTGTASLKVQNITRGEDGSISLTLSE